MPDEVIMCVLMALDDPRALVLWGLTSRRHARLAHDDSVWRRLCELRFGPLLHREHARWGKDWRWLYRAQGRIGATTGADVGGADVDIRAYGRHVYWGDLKDGKPHGYGLALKRSTGHHQKGSFVRAKNESADPAPHSCIGYEGQWRRGCMHGHGVYTYSTGGHYRGEWRDNDRHGFGVDTLPDGSCYTGQWCSDDWHGYGLRISVPDGRTYRGQWVHDVKHGFGVFVYPDGARYHGNFRHNVRDGQGQYTWPKGKRYDGAWCNDVRHGPGVVVYTDGAYLCGEWWEGNIRGHGVLHRPDGSYYQGECADDMRHGHGVWVKADGSRYDGQWTRDRRDGEGTWDYPDGSRAQGRWAHKEIVSGHVVWHSGGANSCHPGSPCKACTVVGSKAPAQDLMTLAGDAQQPPSLAETDD
ncbi:Morn repeat protein [Pandoravirus inopinatum]|uniref:Morn repeat protein n=1 Tax=Pandoravirus inopinatum TaxID=1605721 RepID=A0A0B5J987_9VIRU|nr:Morn repeat protein [Pandoravirus inopinatum]AJF97406.1 Morn repeat protein [Pandoravirus inopinatum]